MDYSFKKDFYGQYSIELPSEQQAFGPWLTEEIGTNRATLDKIIAATQQLLNKCGWDYHHPGVNLRLTLNREQASIRSGDDLGQDDVEDGMSYCDNLHSADCGLEDFALLIQAWRAFIDG
ncbi:hypothetical protein EDC56_2394 [Sinobacterium caligoides]|uniref:Uncharacterized protein n=1 Tax=Sinobacterium caligoides TaxID=933926 RepID=A0A3N2DRL9_9GAMM|nr:YacL family protein [Sinobacterium caligoides]ROS01945.1 hypothetical protein EDC56_2394 [Sinobacterium caligoides]